MTSSSGKTQHKMGRKLASLKSLFYKNRIRAQVHSEQMSLPNARYSQDQSPIFKLPGEIRESIYMYCFTCLIHLVVADAQVSSMTCHGSENYLWHGLAGLEHGRDDSWVHNHGIEGDASEESILSLSLTCRRM